MRTQEREYLPHLCASKQVLLAGEQEVYEETVSRCETARIRIVKKRLMKKPVPALGADQNVLGGQRCRICCELIKNVGGRRQLLVKAQPLRELIDDLSPSGLSS